MFDRRIRGRFLAVLTATLLCQAAVAQTSAPDKAAAEALFQQGTALTAEQRHAEACTKFEASQELDPALGTMLHLGDCYERTGKTASAWAIFREAASVASETGQAERQRIALERASSLEKSLSKITLAPAETPPGLVLKLNGRAIPKASWDVPLPVDPGKQLVEASAPERQPWSDNVVASPGPAEKRVVIPALTEAPPEEPAAAEPPPSRPAAESFEPLPQPVVQETAAVNETQQTAGWILGGAGVTALVAGGVLGYIAHRKNEASLDYCRADRPNACTAEGVTRRESARDFATASTIVMIGGGALVAGGLTLVLTAPTPSRSAQGRPNAFVQLSGSF
jgi:hypothetical protein